MTRVALVTDAESLPIDFDMEPLLTSCAMLGLRPEIADWTDPNVDWAAYDVVLLRSTWSHKDRLEDFLSWCKQVNAKSFLLNPLNVISWGLDKSYLQDLAGHGVPIIPSTFLEPGQDVQSCLSSVLDQHPDSNELVLKPTVGAYSENVGRFTRDDFARALDHANMLFAKGKRVIVQPYLTSIDELGETDMVFFNGTYSHAIRKAPLLAPDGTVNVPTADTRSARVASDAEKAVGTRALNAVSQIFGLNKPLLYARIDLVRDHSGSPVILEMEISEPSLNLPFAPGSSDHFATEIANRLAIDMETDLKRVRQ